MSAPPPNNLFSMPADPGQTVRHGLLTIKREFGLAVLIYVALAAGALIAVRRLPPGEAFILSARGWGAAYEFGAGVVMLTVFYLLYTLPSLVVRRSLGCTLRLLMFGLFIVFLTFMQAGKVVAVVRNEEEFVFVRRWPFGQASVPSRALGPANVRDTGWVRALTVEVPDRPGHPRLTFDCEPVFHADPRTGEVLDRLVKSLDAARGL